MIYVQSITTYCILAVSEFPGERLLPAHKSGFRKGVSTTTALLDVIDNILIAQDIGRLL